MLFTARINKNKMKETAVEWFLNEFQKQVWFEENSELDLWIKDLIPKAKAMEKQQIMDAVYYAMGTNFDPNMGRAEQYYNEIYESKTNL